jgi:hypothetical protein
MPDRLYSFVFRGLLTEEALDKAGRISKSTFTEFEAKKISESLCINDLDEEIVIRAKKMSIVFTAISSFENTVRNFVSKVLLESFGENWWIKSVQDNIRTKAESRKEEENKIRWHTNRGDSLINYTDFGDLVNIMKKNENWPLFEPHLVSIEWANQIIKSIERSRNVIMHSGDLSNEDIERIGTYIRDWIKQIGA